MSDLGRADAVLNLREPQRLAAERFDLVVVGGGVYGALVALEAVRRGLRPLVLERADFAAATSASSLRIIHGGLRYLQSADLVRHRLSVRERAWFLETFPDFVRPLPMLMPLRGEGIRRRSVFRCAFAANDLLSDLAAGHMAGHRGLPAARTLSAARVREIDPGIAPGRLEGGAVWHDGFAASAPVLVVEMLRWACSRGAAALNYVEAREVLRAGDRVAGVAARDLVENRDVAFRADVVVNAAGPWAPRLARSFDVRPAGPSALVLAWNVALRRAAWCDHALAVTPPAPGAQTYFLVPWKGALLAGTGYAPACGDPDRPHVPEALLRPFIDDLNRAVPGFDLTLADVAGVMPGLLPAARDDRPDPATRFAVADHGRRGGLAGAFSLKGVKFTEARAVADAVMGAAFPARTAVPYAAFPRPPRRVPVPDHTFDWLPDAGDAGWLAPLREIVRLEPVVHLADLMLRRSDLGDNPERAIALAPLACGLFAWDAARIDDEIAALRQALAAGAAPGGADAPAGAAAAR